MKTRVAINGFGRIGRNAFKVAFDRDDIEIVAINDLTDTKTLAHLLKYDSNYGTYNYEVGFDDTGIIVNNKHIAVLAEKEPANLPWKDNNIDVVIESTGFFVDPAKARAHIDAGAKKVVLSAPEKGEGATTIVLGVNEDKLEGASDIISNASCTTNCITPVAAVIEAEYGIDKAMMTTVHSYTASQKLQDAPAKDLREARNAAENIVPTTTGASIAAAKALPALKGIFGGMSVRVPTPVVSLSDFVIITKKPVTVESVNETFKKAAKEPFYQGILDVSEDELVSSDFIGNSHSAIVDLSLTAVVGDNMLKVVAWYDNEWGYSNRLVEVVADVGKLLNNSGSEQPAQAEEPISSAPALTPTPPQDVAPLNDASVVNTPVDTTAPIPEPQVNIVEPVSVTPDIQPDLVKPSTVEPTVIAPTQPAPTTQPEPIISSESFGPAATPAQPPVDPVAAYDASVQQAAAAPVAPSTPPVPQQAPSPANFSNTPPISNLVYPEATKDFNQ